MSKFEDSEKNKKIFDLHNFMLEKSNSANAEPVFTDKDGNEHQLDAKAAAVIDNILEQAFIPYLAVALVEEGYQKQENCNYIETPAGLDGNETMWECDKCGEAWTLLEGGTPEEHNMHYCPQCGAKIARCIPKEEIN